MFASAGAVTNAMSVGPGTLFALLLPVQFLLLTRVTSVTLTTYQLRRSALRLVLMASVPVSVIALLQYLDVGPVRNMIVELTGAENFDRAQELGFAARATGPFDHWHVLAGYLLPVVLLGVALLFDRTQQIMSTGGLAACVGAAVIAMALTLTFTTAFGLLVGVGLIAARAGRLGRFLQVGAVATLVLAAVLGPSMGDRITEQFEPRAGRQRASFVPESVDYRFEVWQEQYLPAVAERPVLGYGPELPDSITWVYTESMYLSLQLLGGLPLVLAFGALVLTFFTSMAPGERSRDPSVWAPARAVIAVTIVLIPMHAIFPYFASPGLPHLVWLLAGVASAVDGHNRSTPETEPTKPPQRRSEPGGEFSRVTTPASADVGRDHHAQSAPPPRTTLADPVERSRRHRSGRRQRRIQRRHCRVSHRTGRPPSAPRRRRHPQRRTRQRPAYRRPARHGRSRRADGRRRGTHRLDDQPARRSPRPTRRSGGGGLHADRYDDEQNVATAAYAHDYESVMARYESDPSRILFDLWNGHISLRRDAYLRACEGDDPWPRRAFYEDRNVGLRLHRLGLVGRFDRELMASHHHVGDLRSFRRIARAMGYGDRLLHERHPDLLGPYDPDEWVDDLALPLRWVVRLGNLPGARH